MFANILLAICAIALIIVIKKYLRFRRLINKFPGEDGHPIFGSVFEYTTDADENFQKFRKLNETFKTSYRVWGLPGVAAIIITIPEHAEAILSSPKHITKGIVYKFLMPWLKTGLLTSTGTKWASRRKLITPAFHFNILKRLMEPFAEHNGYLINMIKKECHKDKVDVVPIMSHIALNLICATSMGVNLETKSGKEESIKYRNAIHHYNPILQTRLTSQSLYLDWMYRYTALFEYQEKVVKVLHRFTSKIVKLRQESYIEDDDHETEAGYSKSRLALLDLLISAKNKTGLIDDAGIQEEVDTFTFEGHDTVSMTLSFALLVLANYKEHQEKVILELDELFHDSDRDATYQDLQNMPYLELCLKESLRLFPSVSLISRYLSEDAVLDDEYTIPAGTFAYISIYDVHRNEKHYPEPNKFIPERFLPENVKSKHPYSYIPFSAGPRNCIGQKYAMMELKSIVSCILRNFRLEPVDKMDVTICLEMIIRPKDGIFVKFVPRNK